VAHGREVTLQRRQQIALRTTLQDLADEAAAGRQQFDRASWATSASAMMRR
jgi:hypothetical protein